MIKRIGWFLLALIAGYAAMNIGIFGVQEGLFGGVTFQETPLPQLLIAGLLTTACAVLGGAVAASIFRKPFFPPALGMCGLVIAESTYMIGSGRMPGPLWFDVMAATSLVFGILLGAFLFQMWEKRPVAKARKSLA